MIKLKAMPVICTSCVGTGSVMRARETRRGLTYSCGSDVVSAVLQHPGPKRDYCGQRVEQAGLNDDANDELEVVAAGDLRPDFAADAP